MITVIWHTVHIYTIEGVSFYKHEVGSSKHDHRNVLIWHIWDQTELSKCSRLFAESMILSLMVMPQWRFSPSLITNWSKYTLLLWLMVLRRSLTKSVSTLPFNGQLLCNRNALPCVHTRFALDCLSCSILWAFAWMTSSTTFPKSLAFMCLLL